MRAGTLLGRNRHITQLLCMRRIWLSSRFGCGLDIYIFPI